MGILIPEANIVVVQLGMKMDVHLASVCSRTPSDLAHYLYDGLNIWLRQVNLTRVAGDRMFRAILSVVRIEHLGCQRPLMLVI